MLLFFMLICLFCLYELIYSWWEILAKAVTRTVLPIPKSVCSIYVCPNNGMAGSAWDF